MNKKLLFRVRLLICATFAAVAVVGSVPLGAEALDWPTKAITLLVGYSAGGTSDLGARFLARALEKQLGQPVIVENRPGGGAWVALNQLLYNTSKDGYTFALTNPAVVYGHYDPLNPRKETIDDFELLANQAIDYQSIVIHTDETRFKDLASLIEYAKTNDILTAGATSGYNSGEATLAKWLEKTYGCKIIIVPVEGAKDGETMFVSKNIDILLANVGDIYIGHQKGDFKAIAVFGDERSKMLPEVPTAKELGVNYVSHSVRGYSYAKGVDQAIAMKMRDALAKAIQDPEHIKQMNDLGIEVKLLVGDEFRKELEKQLDLRLSVWGLSK
jgi:tripartite-type tricarboxylate transporter receptor subunit TctC